MIHIKHKNKRASIIPLSDAFLEKSFLDNSYQAMENLRLSGISMSYLYLKDGKIIVDFLENTKFVRISVITSETRIDKIYLPKIRGNFYMYREKKKSFIDRVIKKNCFYNKK
jgi:hypothetical protein